MRFAQTNVQLYNQAIKAGYAEEDLALLRRAYEYGMLLFSAKYHPSGKPLLAHLVGSASLLVFIKVPMPVVCGGLLHAAYRHGDFGDGSKGITRAKRDRLRKHMGAEVEALVRHFQLFDWRPQTIPSIAKEAVKLPEAERNSVLLKLANELEDQLDQATLFCMEFSYQKFYLNGGYELMAGIAEDLGYPDFAGVIRKCFREVTGDRPAVLRRETNRGCQILPASCKRTLRAAIGSRLREAGKISKRSVKTWVRKIGSDLKIKMKSGKT